MYDRIHTFSHEELSKIHDASIDLLETVGVRFDDDEAVNFFKSNGFKVDGTTVFFTEKSIRCALDTAPSNFKLVARDPAKSVAIGGDDFALVPGYGASFITSNGGLQREATLDDYQRFCQLVQTSKVINVNGFLMVSPWDLQPETAHLEMLYANIAFCDKPFMGSPLSREAARDCVNMLGIVWGGLEKLKEMPVTVSLITPLSPFRYTAEMAGSIIELARHNQACIFGALVMAGSSGPMNFGRCYFSPAGKSWCTGDRRWHFCDNGHAHRMSGHGFSGGRQINICHHPNGQVL
jgi:trimethylamine--corrinoid protein Co-methyltransferase